MDCGWQTSGWRDLNPRPSAWEADALPLSYTRMIAPIILIHLQRCQEDLRADLLPVFREKLWILSFNHKAQMWFTGKNQNIFVWCARQPRPTDHPTIQHPSK